MNQRGMKQNIEIGGWGVSTAKFWQKNGHFKNEDEARGAFRLAYQQGLDGMGKSIAEWMGLTSEEFDLWMKRESVPKRKKGLEGVALKSYVNINRWVAYLDLLGIKDLINTSYWTKVFEVYADSIDHFKKDSFDSHLLKKITFSDSFIIYTIDDTDLAYRAIDSFIRYFFVSLIKKKIPVRGSMSFGEFYADDESGLYFGAALNEANMFSELQDWIGFMLTETAVKRLGELGLPADERLNYAYYPIPLKKYTVKSEADYINLPAFIIGNSPSTEGQKPCRKALLSMQRNQTEERIKNKYLRTLDFLSKNERNVVTN